MKIQELKEQKETEQNKLTQLSESLNEGEVFNEDQLQQWDEVKGNLDNLDSQIQTAERLLAVKKPEAKSSTSIIFTKKKPNVENAFRAWTSAQLNRKEWIQKDWLSDNLDLHSAIESPVRWDQSVGVDDAGGFAVNESVIGGVVRNLKAFGGMLSACKVFSTSNAAPIKKNIHDSTTFKAVKTAELATITQTQRTLGNVVFGGTDYAAATTEISAQLVRDSAYDIVGEFQKDLAESFGRGLNESCTTGTGTGEPDGIVAAVSAATPTVLSHDGILELMHSVNEAYHASNKCGFMCSQQTLLDIKKALKDADGRPMYTNAGNNSVVQGFSYQIEGKPVWVNSDIPAGTLLFGDMESYEIRLVGNMVIRPLNELFAMTNAIVYVGHWCWDGRLSVADGIKKLVVA